MAKEPHPESYEEALHTVQTLNPAPQVLAQAQKKLKDPHVEVDEIVDTVKSDPSLTTDIIRISNGAYYGYETKCSNLHEAVHRLGMQEIMRLVGLSISKALFSKELAHYEVSHESHWSRSIAAALLMEALAQMHHEAADDAYTVGLLHAVGRLIISQLMDDFGLDATWDGKEPLHEWEKEHVGFSYDYAGAMILNRWDFAHKITHPILYHLKPPKPELGWSLHAYLHFCNFLLEYLGEDLSTKEWEVTDELQELMNVVMIDEPTLRELVDRTRENMKSLQKTMS